MRILITGAQGMLGLDVARAAAAAGHEPVALGHAELDVADAAAVAARIAAERPQLVVNCAAFTDVDGAERAEAAALAVNGAGAGNVAAAAAACGAWVVHVSSDYVFDGAAGRPYVESDRPAPINAYGRTKLAGERAVAAAAAGAHTIVRSSWLFGCGGRCFPETILRLAGEREQLRVVDDQRGCPTATADLAGALLELGVERPVLGVVHVAGGGSCTWFEFAREIVRRAGLRCAVEPCASGELPRPARRPAYSVLRSEREQAPRLPDWRTGLDRYLAGMAVAR
jgi:dTDP-4-dehydrorhamnose reductase